MNGMRPVPTVLEAVVDAAKVVTLERPAGTLQPLRGALPGVAWQGWRR